MLEAVERLHEQNPMLGLRGCRLGILFPEIVEMQVRAIATAAARLKKEGKNPIPEVMVPLVGTAAEMSSRARAARDESSRTCSLEEGVDVPCMIGTMMEVPRACLVADAVAEHAEFFSFGTNDLTQTTFGYSRDDAEGKFLQDYLDEGVLPVNPFESLDRDGVGKLMRIAIELGRKTRRGPGDRHLRRARRRPGLGRVVPRAGARLRQLRAGPRSDCPPCCGSRCPRLYSLR